MYSQICWFTSIIRNSNCYNHLKYWTLSLPFFTQGLKWLKTEIFDVDEFELHIEVRLKGIQCQYILYLVLEFHLHNIRIFDTAASVTSLKLQNYRICFFNTYLKLFFYILFLVSFINKPFPKQTSFLNHCIF